MGGYKKEAARKERQGKSGDGRQKGENFYRNAKKQKTLSMFKSGGARHNKYGDVVQPGAYQSRDAPAARIEPHRKYFGNTRVIAQDSLAQFREAVKQTSDPYTYLLKSNKLPMSLIRDGQDEGEVNGLKRHAAKMAVETNPFKDVFGPNSRRKRVKLDVSGMEEMAEKRQQMEDEYRGKRKEQTALNDGGREEDDANEEDAGETTAAREPIFFRGQSKRIWNELYKVADSSDVLIQVLDARDPEGTRCHHIERYLKMEAPHKHVCLVLNKCDLVPTKIAATWVKTLSKEYPTLAFHSSIRNPFGKGSLISLLRQFSSLHKSRAQISVGMIGYPNVGKSSLIGTLRGERVCKTSPLPGETKVWQYIRLDRRIYLIDCPGVVPPNQNDSDSDLLLRGVVRVENVANPAQYVHAALNLCERRHIERTYSVTDWTDAEEFLGKLADKSGRLLKGGERDLDGVAKIFLNDFLRGRVPWFVKPHSWGEAKAVEDGPGEKDEEDDDTKTKGDVTALNQQATLNARKRKREELEEENGQVKRQGSNNVDVGLEVTPDDRGGELESLSSDEEGQRITDKHGDNNDDGMPPFSLDAGEDVEVGVPL